MKMGRQARAIGVRKSRGARGGALALAIALPAVVGCDREAINACHDQMNSSQQVMLDMDSSDIDEVEKALAAVESTLAACRKADRSDEVKKIASAQRQVAAQLKALKERRDRKKKPKLSEAQLKELQKKGDPSCPKGQQYEHHQNKKLIRCTGPHLIEMGFAEAKEHFERRGYTAKGEGKLLSLEQGVRRYDFEYSEAGSKSAPTCLSITAQPGVPWQEVVTRATGVHPRKLALDKPVRTKKGKLGLIVEGSYEQYTVKLGTCTGTPGQKPVKAEP